MLLYSNFNTQKNASRILRICHVQTTNKKFKSDSLTWKTELSVKLHTLIIWLL